MKSEKNLKVSLLQWDLAWEDKEANFQKLDQLLQNVEAGTLVILPELFSTAFTMNNQNLAETMKGKSLERMKDLSQKYNLVLAGSLIIRDEEDIFNRLLWVQPDSQIYHYDKAHLFTMADEDRYYCAGKEKIITQLQSWKILPQVCFDLRFPVWQRNQEGYDLMIVVASWPKKRIDAWEKLLQARAIENQSYVIGVNRIGTDPQGVEYNGHSMVINPMGQVIKKMNNQEEHFSYLLDKEFLNQTREKLPFLQERDNFILL